jgi:uncharacterized protein involved in type VI secretion and phage assembly
MTTPLGADRLLLRQFTGQEALSRPFRCQAELLSEEAGIAPEARIGQHVSIDLDLTEGEVRHFDAFVEHFTRLGRHGELARYRAEPRPWFWFLTLTQDCRVFKRQTVPEIFEENNFGYGDRPSLRGSPQLPYAPPARASGLRYREAVTRWRAGKAVRSGCYTRTDYDFTQPRALMQAQTPWAREHPHGKYRVFNYPGRYQQLSDGEAYANAIRFEDIKGEEQLWLHAKKGQLTEVEYDQENWAGNHRRKTIDGNEITIAHKHHIETVDQQETISIGGSKAEILMKSRNITKKRMTHRSTQGSEIR